MNVLTAATYRPICIFRSFRHNLKECAQTAAYTTACSSVCRLRIVHSNFKLVSRYTKHLLLWASRAALPQLPQASASWSHVRSCLVLFMLSIDVEVRHNSSDGPNILKNDKKYYSKLLSSK